MKQSMQLCIDPKAIMNGFCYNYCKALLEEIILLSQNDEVFDERGAEYGFTDFARSILGNITQQTYIPTPPHTQKKLEHFIEITEKFLKIFEKK